MHKPRLFAESEHQSGGRFKPRQGVVTEVRKRPAPDVRANTHGAPQPRGFNSTTIVHTEKCTVVGHDDFASCIENRRSGYICIDLAIDQRRTAVLNECRKAANSCRNVREEAAAEQRTSAEVIEAVYVINQTVNCMRQDAKRLIQHRRGEPAFKVVDIGEVPLDIKVVRESGACLQTIHTPVPEVSVIRMVRPEEPGVRMNFYLVLVTKEVRPRHDRKWRNDIGNRFCRAVVRIG